MRVIFRYRAWLAAALVAFSLACAAGIPRLTFDDNFRELFRAESDSFATYEQLLRDFGSDEYDCLVLVEADDMLSADALGVVKSIHSRASKLPGVVAVHSIFAARQPQRVGRYFLPLIPGDLSDTARLDAAHPRLRDHPLVRGQLLSQDGRATLIVVQLDEHAETASGGVSVVAKLRHLLAECTTGTAVSARLTGLPAVRVEVMDAIRRDHFVFGAIGPCLAFLVAWFLLRRLAPLLIAFAAPVTGVIWILGIMGWSGVQLNAVNALVPTLIIVIGLSDSVHMIFHVIHELDVGHTPQESALSALQLVGVPCIFTAVTTAIGFVSLVMMQQPVLQQFGLTCALGTMLALAAALLIVPLLASTRLGWRCKSPAEIHRAGASGSTTPTTATLGATGDFVLRVLQKLLKHPAAASAVGIVATIVLFGISLWMRPDFRYTENLPDQNEAYATLRDCDRLFAGSSVVSVVVDLAAGVTLANPQPIDALRDIHASLQRQAVFSPPLSLLNVLQSLPGDSDNLSLRVSELRYLPGNVLAHFISANHRKLQVSARVPDVGSARLQVEFDALEQQLRAIERRYPGYRLTLTGLPVMSTYSTQGMIPSLACNMATDSILIFGIMFISLRSLRLGLISILPNVFPLVAAAAGLVLFRVPLRYSYVMCFSICLGIAVDDTIHVLFTYRRELQRGLDPAAAITRTMQSIMPAIVTTALLIVVGFGVAMFSSMPTVRLFRALTCAILILALLAELFLTPVLVCMAARSSMIAPTAPTPAGLRAGKSGGSAEPVSVQAGA